VSNFSLAATATVPPFPLAPPSLPILVLVFRAATTVVASTSCDGSATDVVLAEVAGLGFLGNLLLLLLLLLLVLSLSLLLFVFLSVLSGLTLPLLTSVLSLVLLSILVALWLSGEATAVAADPAGLE
jgi:hypothetical protein